MLYLLRGYRHRPVRISSPPCEDIVIALRGYRHRPARISSFSSSLPSPPLLLQPLPILSSRQTPTKERGWSGSVTGRRNAHHTPLHIFANKKREAPTPLFSYLYILDIWFRTDNLQLSIFQFFNLSIFHCPSDNFHQYPSLHTSRLLDPASVTLLEPVPPPS